MLSFAALERLKNELNHSINKPMQSNLDHGRAEKIQNVMRIRQ